MSVFAEVVGLLRFQVDKSSYTSATSQVKSLAGAVQAAIGADIVGRLTGSIHEFVSAADDLGDQAEVLGLSARDLQAYTAASEQLGVSQEQLGMSFQRLATHADGANKGLDESRKLFARLGVNVQNSDGTLKSVGELLPGLADGLQRVENPTQRAALAMQLFGRQAGGKLRVLLEQGGEGLEKLKQQFDELGGGISEDAIKKADAFEASLARARVRMRAFGSELLSQILPGLTKFGDVLGSAQGPLEALTKGSGIWGDTLAVTASLGVAAAASMALAEGRAALLGKAVLGIGAASLVLNDLKAYTQGADSAFGQLLKTIGGMNQADETLRNFTAGVSVLKDVLSGKNGGVSSRDVTDTLFPGLKLKQAEKQLEWLKARGDLKYSDREEALERRVKELRDKLNPDAMTGPIARATGQGLTAPVQVVEGGRVAADTVQQFNTTVTIEKATATAPEIEAAVTEGISKAAAEARQNNRRKSPVSP